MGDSAPLQTQASPPPFYGWGRLMPSTVPAGMGRGACHNPVPPDTPAWACLVFKLAKFFRPVEALYESLNVHGTKKAYRELNTALDGLASKVVRTMEQIVPYLARMQSLLSQRGTDRKKVLKKAGLPKWTQWAGTYAQEPGLHGSDNPASYQAPSGGPGMPNVRSGDYCENRASGDGNSNPDWKSTLVKLVNALELCGDSLPLLAKTPFMTPKR